MSRFSRVALLGVAALLSPACFGLETTPPGGASSGGGGSTTTSGDGGSADPCDVNGVSKGPWVQHIDGHSARIRWEACREGVDTRVAYSQPGGQIETVADGTASAFVLHSTYTAPLAPDVPPDHAGTYWLHEVTLDKLQPGTCYDYHLLGSVTRSGHLCSARPSGQPLRFMAIGDTNPGIGPYAKGILDHLMPLSPDFVVHGGDIQYYSSGLETWSLWFEIMQPMLSRGGFFPAVGNHEIEINDEYRQFSLRYFADAGFDGTSTHYTFENAGIHFFCLDTQDSIDITSLQGTWLLKGLYDATKAPGFRFSVVYFHKPFVTCGDTGDDPIARQEFEPYFSQYKVPLILQAHMHGYERFELGEFTYVTTAGGGGIIGDVNANVSRDYCKDRVSSGGFRHGMIFDLKPGKLEGRAIDYTGKLRDQFTLDVP
jgi:acid phosphatase type 7